MYVFFPQCFRVLRVFLCLENKPYKNRKPRHMAGAKSIKTVPFRQIKPLLFLRKLILMTELGIIDAKFLDLLHCSPKK